MAPNVTLPLAQGLPAVPFRPGSVRAFYWSKLRRLIKQCPVQSSARTRVNAPATTSQLGHGGSVSDVKH
jgi:hypothetical protein